MNNGRAACYTRLGSNEHGAGGWRTRGLQTSPPTMHRGKRQMNEWDEAIETAAKICEQQDAYGSGDAVEMKVRCAEEIRKLLREHFYGQGFLRTDDA
jgi:hypothetical protein